MTDFQSTLNAAGLEKHYPTRGEDLRILRGVDLALRGGQSLAVMGPSGSGKSTLLNLLGTLEPPSNGRLLIDGRNPFELGADDLARFRNQHIGFVFQEHHLLPQCSVLENVLLPSLAGNHPPRADRARELLERMQLSDRLDHRPGELSGGERQRVAIARALINEPSLVLADEPTGNLDRKTAGRVADLLVELPPRDGVVLIVVTHSESLAARFDRVAELDDGRLVDAQTV
jgi:lipoprotein-releasing system ATP-binding protein